MRSHVHFGSTRKYELQHAIMVYSDSSRSFATVHKPLRDSNGALVLGAGQGITTDFLRALTQSLGSSAEPEVLPPNVLCRTSDMLVWWTPSTRRTMFFTPRTPEAERLNGRCFSHPALVFKVHAGRLFVRALSLSVRPDADARLFVAPYWNTNDRGDVCIGSMRVPDSSGVESMQGWEDGYFGSEFTHPNGTGRLTTHPGGFARLWESLVDGTVFPIEYLVDARQTLAQFVKE
jgi:PRTRC genetic system protein B